jgi:hypothetical protein
MRVDANAIVLVSYAILGFWRPNLAGGRGLVVTLFRFIGYCRGLGVYSFRNASIPVVYRIMSGLFFGSHVRYIECVSLA